MVANTAGEANIKIVPDASEFLKKLKADLESKKYEYKVPVSADISRAATDLDRFRAEQEARPIKIRTETDRSSFDAVKKQFGELTDSLLSASKSFGAFTAIGELPALATALASVTGVAEQLSGAFAALPGIIGGGLATFGTVKLGLNGVEDAWKALDKAQQDSGKSAKEQAKDLAAVNAALAQLAPNAADAVRTAHDLSKELQDTLDKPIQQNLFAGISDDLKSLYDNDLPTLQKGLGGISTALNGDLRQALQSLGSDSSKGILDRILGNTGDAEARFQKAIDPIIHGIGTLTAGSSDVLPRLADDLGRIATRFDDFITQADKDGSLQKFINNGITGVEQLGDTFLNVGKIIGDITSAAGGGQGLLGTLDDATKRLDEFLKTPKGQESLKTFFAEGKKDIGELIDVAKELPGILKGIFDGGKDAAAVFLPILKDVLSIINAIPGGAQTLADAFLLWKGASVVGAVAELAGSLAGVSGKLDALPDKATTAAGGISKAFKNLNTGAIIATAAGVLGDNLLNPTNPDGSPGSPSVLDKLGGAASNIGGGALAGATVAGPVGAAVGATIGAVVSIFETVTNEINTQKEKFRQQAEQDRNNPDRPGNPDAALAQNPALQNVLQPSLKAPPINATLLPAIRAGKLPGFKLGPDGQTVINTSTGQPVDVSGLNLSPPPPPPPPPPPKPVPTVGGVPFPVVPGAPTPSSVAAVQSPTPVANPVTAGTTIAAKVDPAAQQSIHDLAASITSLPTGEVNIKDGSPVVLESVKKLDTTVTALKDHPGEVIVKANTEEAQAKLDALVRQYETRIITLQLQPQIGGAPPIAPGHASGGVVGYASGGVLPGYSPGKDNMLVPLAGGEGIIRPEAVKKFGPGLIHALNGFATGGVVPDYLSIATGQGGGTAPGPIAPNPAQGGIGSIANSFLGGLGGLFGNVSGLVGGATGGSGGSGLTPGLAGLFQAGTDQNLLGQWGQQTGDWLGNFAAKTLVSFGTALWSGALGLFGLQDSILSPSNPWFQDAAKSAGFFLGQDGPLGGQGGKGSKGPTEKQVREGGQKVQRADQKVAEIQQRISELKPDAKQSQRQSLADQLANAQQDAQDARTDFGTLQSGGTPSTSASASAAGLSGNQAVVYQAMLDAGFPPSEWPSLLNLMNKESGFVPTAKNPKSTAYGMFQFLDSTWGTVGGAKTTDPVLQSKYGLQYIKQRYGSPSAAWAQYYNHPGGQGSYATGGGVPGSGSGDTVPAMLTPGEHVLTTADVKALGGQDGVYRLRNSLHMALGGEIIPLGAIIPPPPRPSPVALPATRPNIPTVPTAPTRTVPSGQAGPAIPDAPHLPPPAAPAPQAGIGAAPVGGGQSTTSHTLPAISTGITSGFATAGSIAQTAASLGSFGAAGGLGGALAGGGGGGPSIAGLFQQAGKIANDVVDVGSAFLVGSVPGSFGDPNLPAGGQTLRPAQRIPQTAPLDSGRTYIFNDTHSDRIVDQMRVKDSQDRQAALAQWGG